MPVTRSMSGKKQRVEESAVAASTMSEAPSAAPEASQRHIEEEQIPAAASTMFEAPSSTLKSAKSQVHSAKKTSSRQTVKSRRELQLAQAKEDLLNLKIELATVRIARLEEEEDDEDDIATNISEINNSERVNSWVKEAQSQLHVATNMPQQPPPSSAAVVPDLKQNEDTRLPEPCTPKPPQKSDISELACAITAAVRSAHQTQAPRYVTDLPFFSGAHLEWLSFKTTFYESAKFFSDVENTARLRRHIKGRAREAVENLLINQTSPEEIMKALEARFGRPDCIASTELQRLRSLPKPADTPRDICIFASQVSNTVAALKALNKVYYLYNPEITKTTIEKLPSSLRYRWFDFAATQPEDQPDLIKISTFLQREAELCGPYAQPEIISAQSHYQAQRSSREHRTFITSVSEKPSKCPACDETDHRILDCKKFKQVDVNTRWDIAKERRLCFRCLRYRNRTHNCRRVKCDIDGCNYYHNKLLHHSKEKPEYIEKEAVASTWTQKKTHSYLKIVPVRVAGPAGEADTWALLDDGSTVTLVDAELATYIGARGPIDPLHIEAITDSKLASTNSRRVSLTLYGGTEHHKINARTIDRLQLSAQTITEQDIDLCLHLEDIKDHIKYQKAAPKILIGQDNWGLLLANEVRKGRRDQPVASRTALGWVLHGAHTRTLGQRVNFVHHLNTETEDSMNEQLKQFFAIENLMIQPKKPQSDPEQRALKILQENTVQLDDGRYQSTLLWKSDAVTMPNNYNNALHRLSSIEIKLARDSTIKEKYCEQMRALIEKEYAEPAPPCKPAEMAWYLPHFAVVNPMKPEKLRIVHDAAAKTGGTSLNSQLLTGPTLLQSLPGVLMRFRRHRVAVSADIAEMFMQVKIKEQDRNFLRYLWRDNNNKDQPPSEFRMTSLIFGATCSPSTAIFVINLNAQKYEKTHPEAAAAILKNHYVDDYLDCHETIEETVRIAKQVRDIHRSGHFELRKWISNSPEVLQELDECEKQITTKSLTDDVDSERVLGLVWKPRTDELTFNLNLIRIPEETLRCEAPTKRDALRIVMSLYDPLGLASPVTIRAKQILQEVWRRGTGWDQQLDTDVARQWRDWMTHLQHLRHVAVPRCYLHYSDAVTLQLHTFVDASEAAYAAALYWRAVTPDGHISVSLILAKSRVAPLKLTSIPRLELQAAVMGCRMAAAVVDEHDRKPDSKTYWTDSKTVLTWLKTGSRSYKPFVAHRIAAIEENSLVNEWRWIPTKQNVADDATRDVPQDFCKTHRWYTGPAFLLETESTWPTDCTIVIELSGEEKCNYTSQNNTTSKLRQCIPDSSRFSKWEKLLRTTARVLQFIHLCRPEKDRTHYKRTRKNEEKDPDWKRHHGSTTPLTTKKKSENTSKTYTKISTSLLRQAEDLIIRASQEESFSQEIETLRKNHAVSSSSRLRSLALSYVNGVIRLISRIDVVSDVSESQMAPPVLDGKQSYSETVD